MPIYDYECPHCKHIEERYVTRDVHLITCTKCNFIAHRIMAKTHFRLSGPGWAKDGYSKKRGD